MNRIFGLTLVAGLALGLNSAAHAQTFPTYSYGLDAYGFGGYGYEDVPFGGFGVGYTQGPPASGIVMNRFGEVVGMTDAAPTSVAPAVQPTTVPQVVNPTIRGRSKKVYVQPRYPLTTGWLGWPDSNSSAVTGYSPAMRERSYGYGYDVSPYGTTQYYGPWKGLTLGY